MESFKEKFNDVIKEIAEMDESQFIEFGQSELVIKFIHSLYGEKYDNKNIYEVLKFKKYRLALIASIRNYINNSYSFEAITEDGQKIFISPFTKQYSEGVILLQGRERFSGTVYFYDKGELRIAFTKREIKNKDDVELEETVFISLEDAKRRLEDEDKDGHISGFRELNELIENEEKSESKYQEYFNTHPWVFGLQYSEINSHKNLDDENIPDFIGKRIKDDTYDVFEIKQPFKNIFKNNDKFNSFFYESYSQAERYLGFIDKNLDYLKNEKKLDFHSAICHLVLGYKLSEEQMNEVRLKEAMNKRIKIYCYNDILHMAKTIEEFKNNIM